MFAGIQSMAPLLILTLPNARPFRRTGTSMSTLPTGMGFKFTNYLSSDQVDLVLSYTFTNTSSTVFSNLYFFVLLDPEIDEQTNTFFNEFGSTSGAPGGATPIA